MESMAEVTSYISNSKQDSDSDDDDREIEQVDKKSNKRYHNEEKTSNDFDPGYLESCKYIPMRLTVDERRLLQVLENALEVSDYTDTVDVFARNEKRNRIINGIIDVMSISCGLLISNNLSQGERLVKDRTFQQNLPFFRDLFEIGRRYKIMNPTKMRNTYGKLMFLLQDTETPAVKAETQMCLIKDVLMVRGFLEDREGLTLLSDPLLKDATLSVDNSDHSHSQAELTRLGITKEKARKKLIEKYSTGKLNETDVERVLSSISDYCTYVDSNVNPVTRMIKLLKENFDPSQPVPSFSLALQGISKPKKSSFGSFGSYLNSGSGYSSRFMGSGACLNHDHSTQFQFVYQSLSLWREIMRNITRLWHAADADLLYSPYRLSDTGQGLNRVQHCPNVRKLMDNILRRVQNKMGSWVGLGVIHLGDRDVPNALVFIDKYSQVPRILAPIAACIESLPHLVHDEAFHAYVRAEWDSLDALRLQILSDFFKHGFDGSGDDGGSCIDGRLTSAWNWCSKLAKKPYYYVFMFTGFQGFDGDWKD